MVRLSDGKWTRPYLFTEEDYFGHVHRSTRYEEHLGFVFTSSAMKVTVVAPSGERLVYKRESFHDKRFNIVEDTRRSK